MSVVFELANELYMSNIFEIDSSYIILFHWVSDPLPYTSRTSAVRRVNIASIFEI